MFSYEFCEIPKKTLFLQNISDGCFCIFFKSLLLSTSLYNDTLDVFITYCCVIAKWLALQNHVRYYKNIWKFLFNEAEFERVYQ